jgi:hypothetical protein
MNEVIQTGACASCWSFALEKNLRPMPVFLRCSTYKSIGAKLENVTIGALGTGHWALGERCSGNACVSTFCKKQCGWSHTAP